MRIITLKNHLIISLIHFFYKVTIEYFIRKHANPIKKYKIIYYKYYNLLIINI
jgi:hypothetical protein